MEERRRVAALSWHLEFEGTRRDSSSSRLGAYPIWKIRLDRRISVEYNLGRLEARPLETRKEFVAVFFEGPIDCLFTRQTERGANGFSSFKFTPLSVTLVAPRASSIRQTKRSHSHLNLYSHVQHTRDYECVGLMKPGKASAFAPPTDTTLLASPPVSHCLHTRTDTHSRYFLPRELFLFIIRRLHRHFPPPLLFFRVRRAWPALGGRGSTAFRGGKQSRRGRELALPRFILSKESVHA